MINIIAIEIAALQQSIWFLTLLLVYLLVMHGVKCQRYAAAGCQPSPLCDPVEACRIGDVVEARKRHLRDLLAIAGLIVGTNLIAFTPQQAGGYFEWMGAVHDVSALLAMTGSVGLMMFLVARLAFNTAHKVGISAAFVAIAHVVKWGAVWL